MSEDYLNVKGMVVTETLPEFRKIIPWKLAVVFILFVAAIIFVGNFYYRSQKRTIFKEQQNNLSAIATLKISQIEQWHKERLGNAANIYNNEPLIKTIKEYLDNESAPDLKREITKWMESVCNEYEYNGITILDLHKKTRMTFLLYDSLRAESIPDEIDNVIRYKRIVMTDLLVGKDKVYMDLLIPLVVQNHNNADVFGVLNLQIDPAKVLFPLIQSWPTPSKTAETLLLRKEGDSVLYLNELRFQKNTALKLKRSLSDKNLLASKAISGYSGIAEGVDYRNKPVIGYIAAFPGLPWYMVAKVDEDEIQAPLKRLFNITGIVIVLLILISAALFGFWIWQKLVNVYKKQLENERAIRESEERFTTAFRLSPVSITISSLIDNKFIDVNQTFLTDMEYNREEVIGRTARELDIWNDENERLWLINEIRERHNIFGKIISFKSKSGKIIYGLCSMSVVKVDGQPCNLSTVVNVTESIKTEEKFQKSEELFRKLFENMLNGFAYCKMIYEEGYPPDFLYIKVNEAFAKLTGIKDVEGKKASVAIPGIQESDPELLERYKRVSVTGKPEVFETYVESLEMWFTISVYSPQKGYFVAVFDVITDRKLAEEKLLENEKRLREAQEMAHLGFWLWDIKSGDVEWSEEVYKIFCLDPETFTPRIDSILELSPWPEENQRDKELITKAIESHEPGTYEQKFLRPDKSIGYYNSTFRGSYDNNGDLVSIVGTILDITDRKLAEDALLESEDKFKYIFEHSAMGNSISHPNGETHFNSAFCEMLGYSAEELAHMKWQDFTHPDDFEITQKVVDSLVSSESNSPRFIKRYLRKDGSVMWADVSTSLRYDKDNKPLYFMTTVNDITDIKLAEEVLRNDEKRFRELIEALPQLYWTCKVGGPCDYLSKQWIEYTGIPESEQLGYGWLKQLHPEDREMTVTAWTEKVKTGTSFDVEFRIRRYDGEYHWFKTRAVPIHNSEGKLIRWLGSNTDIDSIRRAEDQLRNYNKDLEQRVLLRTEQVEAANKELEAFSYSVSHDLRAPLRSIHGFTNILLEDYESQLDEEGKRICGIISSSATQMGELIDDLLSFSRIGRSSLNPSVIDMKKMTRLVFEGLTSPTERERIKLNTGKLHKAFGDVTLFGQVWTNLISNAIKYSSKKNISEINIGSKADGQMITYFIKDNGVGFDMKYAHKLFGVFQRLHSESEFEGNGVGLAIIQRIILKHKGKVWAEGEVGKGATFFFSLPVQDINKKTPDTRFTTQG